MAEIEREGMSFTTAGYKPPQQKPLKKEKPKHKRKRPNGAAVVSVFVFILVRLLMHAAKMFRGIEREKPARRYEGDSDEHVSLRLSSASRSGYLHGVRRRYRRTILQYRKEAPGISETPSEMESAAGLEDSDDMKALHAEYEKVRYGRELSH